MHEQDNDVTFYGLSSKGAPVQSFLINPLDLLGMKEDV